MGWKYEVSMFMHERGGYHTYEETNSLFRAVRTLMKLRRNAPGRAYKLVIR